MSSPPPILVARRTSGWAIASLILACLSMVAGPLSILPAIICGHMARADIRNDPTLDGDSTARAGLIIAYGFVALSVFLVTLFILLVSTTSTTSAPFIHAF